MGVYLNRGNALFMRARRSEIYIDKSEMIEYLNSIIDTEQEYVCVSRPRRFGKSMTANMISAYYDRTCDAGNDFDGLRLSYDGDFLLKANKYDTLFINMQEFLSTSDSMKDLIQDLQKNVIWDLTKEYPDVHLFDSSNMTRTMKDINAASNRTFVVIIDEWDCIFREYRNDTTAQKEYLDFLRAWLKDNASISLVYMTGILPIKKYGTHSAMNMFSEFSMTNPAKLARFVGFTEDEVDGLCKKYNVDINEVKNWYDGYHFNNSVSIYSPRSVVMCMLNGVFSDYWNETETFEALKTYIDLNLTGLRDSIVKLIAGDRQRINTGSFQNDMTSFSKEDDVLTLLVHLGYLGYDIDTGEVYIPNRELALEFITAVTSGNEWSEVADSIECSDKLLEAAWAMDEESVARGIKKAHLETSHLQYNDENALSYTISLAFYSARNYYSLVRELPAGKGFADIAFIPLKKHLDKPAMIVELKWDKSAETAITQIRDKNYPEALKDYKNNLLLIGINYDKKTKKHQCRIEKY